MSNPKLRGNNIRTYDPWVTSPNPDTAEINRVGGGG
jgi:hypothetical protein